jgi:hypothetical protein
MSTSAPRIGLLWRDNATAEHERARLKPIFEALAALHIDAVPVLYSEEAEDALREVVLQLDGVLVWVDPIAYGRSRSRLDALLREAVADGVWVSADPDVVLLMGTKEVLFTTRQLGWGTDTDEYGTAQEFYDRFPARLASSGPWVLKQYRGNGGQGVWKVELLASAENPVGFVSGQDVGPAAVRVLEARRGSIEEDLPLREFMARCTEYFDGFACLIDQPFQERLPEGMIRCYLMHDGVIGFAHQLIRGLMPAPAGSDAASLPQPGPRIMQPPDAQGFEVLRRRMEEDWVPGLCRLLDIDRDSLPVLWDADFLLGPNTAAGEDTFVLCEINVSCITPYPEFAAGTIARTAVYRALRARQTRERS